jgi:hypothetical protein
MTEPTNIMHFIGLPSAALRLCMADDGTPRGMILYGADERRLFAAALTIERYCAPITIKIEFNCLNMKHLPINIHQVCVTVQKNSSVSSPEQSP